MTVATADLPRQQRRKGFVGSQAVLPLINTISRKLGADAARRLMNEARMHALPDPGEPVRERQAAILHQSLRRDYPEVAEAIQREAARDAVEWLIQNRIPVQARLLLSNMPWSMAVWMLGRNAVQNAWTFGGSGKFTALSTHEFQLIGNPLIKGETSASPICAWHEELFQQTFRRMAHSRLKCVETSCMAAGAIACRFQLSMAS